MLIEGSIVVKRFFVAYTVRAGIWPVKNFFVNTRRFIATDGLKVCILIVKHDLVIIRRFVATDMFRAVIKDWFARVINPVQTSTFRIVFRTVIR